MACFRLLTLRPLPDFSLPLFNLCISFFTFCPAFGLYLRLLLERERLRDVPVRDELVRDEPLRDVRPRDEPLRERADAERELPPDDRDLPREPAEPRLEREELREEERERELRER
jgi:hypothetical protein